MSQSRVLRGDRWRDKVIKDGYRLNNAFDGLLAKCSDTGCHNRKAAVQVLTEFIIEFANALGVIHHG